MKILQINLGRNAERIVAKELEARGFRVSDLSSDGIAANADLLVVSSDLTFQVQVEGSANSDVACPEKLVLIELGLSRMECGHRRFHNSDARDYLIDRLLDVDSLADGAQRLASAVVGRRRRCGETSTRLREVDRPLASCRQDCRLHCKGSPLPPNASRRIDRRQARSRLILSVLKGGFL